MLLELPPIPASSKTCFVGCEAQHQQTAFAKKKRHDVVFFVNTLLELPPIPASSKTCFAGCEAQHRQTAFAKKLAEDRHPPVRATRCRVFREHTPQHLERFGVEVANLIGL